MPHPPAGRRVPARPRAARRGLVRSARALAAAALLLLTGAFALPATAQAQTPSTDATLSGGTVMGAGRTLVSFTPDQHSYPSQDHISPPSVSRSTTEVTFAPETNHAEATVHYFKETVQLTDSSMDPDFQVMLLEGVNEITVRVTAQDGTTLAGLHREVETAGRPHRGRDAECAVGHRRRYRADNGFRL